MNYDEFLTTVRKELEDLYPDMSVEITEVSKLQGESYKGVVVKPREVSGIGITMNLNEMFSMLSDGYAMDDVMGRVRAAADKAIHDAPGFDTKKLMDYGQMKEYLIMQAVNSKASREQLRNVPHKDLEDIAIVYRFQLDKQENGEATVLVTNDMLRQYGITREQLIADAEVYAPRNNPIQMRSMAEVIAEMMGGMFPMDEMEEPPLTVCSVPGSVNGSGILGYPDFYKAAAEKIGGDYYVLPSSIHEILILPDDGTNRATELDAMVSGINASEVSPEERLADVCYHYDTKTGLFEKGHDYAERVFQERGMIADRQAAMVMEEAAAYAQPEVISALMVEPNCYPRPVEMGTSLADLQSAVGGFIEVVYPFDDNVGIVVNV